MIINEIKAKGTLSVVLKDQNGNLKDKREINNLVVDSGLDYIASRMKDVTEDCLLYTSPSPRDS